MVVGRVVVVARVVVEEVVVVGRVVVVVVGRVVVVVVGRVVVVVVVVIVGGAPVPPVRLTVTAFGALFHEPKHGKLALAVTFVTLAVIELTVDTFL